MSAESEEHISDAGTLLRQAKGGAPIAPRCFSPGSGPDLCELFLAELRMRRARLREWIEMLSEEAGNQAAARKSAAPTRPRACRGRNRQVVRTGRRNEFEA